MIQNTTKIEKVQYNVHIHIHKNIRKNIRKQNRNKNLIYYIHTNCFIYKMANTFDKSAILKTFNTHFFDFIDEIVRILPDNQEVQIARTSFDTIRRANPTAIAKAWYLFVYKPYEKVFENGNISFFFDKDYSSDLQSLHNSSRILEMIDKIRDPIKNMGPENLAHSTKYIQNLCKLSILYSQPNEHAK